MAFEQSGPLVARFHLENVDCASVQVLVAFVGELVVRCRERLLRRVALGHVVHFRLQEPRNHVALNEGVAGKLSGLKLRERGAT